LEDASTSENNRQRLGEIKATAEDLLITIANVGSGNTSEGGNASENGNTSTSGNVSNGGNTNTSVKTGDNGVTIWLILMMLSFMVFVVATIKSREE